MTHTNRQSCDNCHYKKEILYQQKTFEESYYIWHYIKWYHITAKNVRNNKTNQKDVKNGTTAVILYIFPCLL